MNRILQRSTGFSLRSVLNSTITVHHLKLFAFKFFSSIWSFTRCYHDSDVSGFSYKRYQHVFSNLLAFHIRNLMFSFGRWSGRLSVYIQFQTHFSDVVYQFSTDSATIQAKPTSANVAAGNSYKQNGIKPSSLTRIVILFKMHKLDWKC